MKATKKWSKHISPVGWYVASVLIRLEWNDEDKSNLNRRSLAWENQILLLAVYDELEDGAEITWREYENRSVKKVKSWAKPKEELEVFEIE